MSTTPNYSRKLARVITLADGTKLRTLLDAAQVFEKKFATVIKWGHARSRA